MLLPTNRPPTHPGEMLLEEFLMPRTLSRTETAARMEIPPNRLNEIVRGKRGVTANTALRLAKLLGTDAHSWVNLQNAWDLWHAQRAMKRSARTTRAHASRPAVMGE
jgi:addiction module HigA family antidote